jgi:transglutaminase-like putative cysteine protease
LVLQIARALVAGPSLTLALEFAAFLQISRLFNRRSAAEYQQIAVLSFLHLIAATILTTSLIYAAVFLGFVISTPWMLALTNLRHQVESNYSGSQGPNDIAVAGIRRVLASKRVVGPSFLWGTAAIAVPLFLITLAIFVAVPRVGKGFFPFQRAKGQRVTGFGSFVELGGFGVIRDDPTVVLRIKEVPENQSRAASQLFRMRGTSFDHYDGKRWTRSPSQRIPFSRTRGYYPVKRWPEPSRDRRLQIFLDHLDQRVVFLPDDTVALEFSLGMLKGLSKAPKLFLSEGLDIRYIDEGELGLIYNTYTNKDAWRYDSKSLDARQTKRYLQIPQNHDSVVLLAQRIAQPAKNTAAKIMRIQAYLRDSGGFRYSLEQPDVGDKPPLVAFLFRAKQGHCEYFSTAMAIMLRGIGVPSRNVTGFVGGRYNPFGGYWALRQGDAHSWVEAFVQGTGWITLDPTPPAMTAVGPTDGLWADIYALFDAIRTRWETSIIAYDLQTQVVMLQGVIKWMARFRSDAADTAARSNDAVESSARTATYFTLAILSILVLSVLVWAIVRQRRVAHRARTTLVSKDASDAVALYRDLEQVLTRMGHARPPSTTPLEHSRRLYQKGFPKADAVETITQRYMEVRFGNQPLTPSEVKSLRAIVSEIRATNPS